MRESMNELMKTVETSVEQTLSPIQYHIYFNLQQIFVLRGVVLSVSFNYIKHFGKPAEAIFLRSFYECGLNCFNNKKASQDQIQNCLQRCQAPLQRAQAIVDNELNKFQERMERSVLTCRDKVEAYGDAIVGDDAKLQEMEKCMGISLKEQMKTLPHLANNIQSKLASNK